MNLHSHHDALLLASLCYVEAMRTTITLEPDVAAAVERMRRTEGVAVSEAVNRLIRAGTTAPTARTPYQHTSADLGLRVDVTNIGDVLDLLDNQ